MSKTCKDKIQAAIESCTQPQGNFYVSNYVKHDTFYVNLYNGSGKTNYKNTSDVLLESTCEKFVIVTLDYSDLSLKEYVEALFNDPVYAIGMPELSHIISFDTIGSNQNKHCQVFDVYRLHVIISSEAGKYLKKNVYSDHTYHINDDLTSAVNIQKNSTKCVEITNSIEVRPELIAVLVCMFILYMYNWM